MLRSQRSLLLLKRRLHLQRRKKLHHLLHQRKKIHHHHQQRNLSPQKRNQRKYLKSQDQLAAANQLMLMVLLDSTYLKQELLSIQTSSLKPIPNRQKKRNRKNHRFLLLLQVQFQLCKIINNKRLHPMLLKKQLIRWIQIKLCHRKSLLS
jgi:hypothetical protein